jgi:hypothetical protein
VYLKTSNTQLSQHTWNGKLQATIGCFNHAPFDQNLADIMDNTTIAMALPIAGDTELPEFKYLMVGALVGLSVGAFVGLLVRVTGPGHK